MVAPMREYIEEWLTKELVNIIETDQHEVVIVVIPPPSQKQPSTKDASRNK